MHRGEINEFVFILEQETNRIFVYKDNSDEPFTYINVSEDLSEKDFHYEIMDFVAKQA